MDPSVDFLKNCYLLDGKAIICNILSYDKVNAKAVNRLNEYVKSNEWRGSIYLY